MEPRSKASQVIHALRRVNLEGSVFGQTVAIRFGLSESDIEALERLAEVGTTTAGRLGDLMGLSSGAVTRVLDRLEQSGFIRRTVDPGDRRRVVVTLVPEKAAAIEALTDRLARASEAELRRYTADQLDAIADFLSRMSDVTREETESLRGAADAGEASAGEHGAPLGGLTAGHFALRGGANQLTFRAAPGPMADLYRAEFTGAIPQVRLRNGVVSVQYRASRPWDWRQRTAEFSLNPTVPWDASISGGGSRISVEATGLDLRGFELSGGVDRLSLSLGQPRGEVALRVSGGAAQIRLERPAGVPVRVHVSGGAGGIDLDGRRMIGAGSFDVSTPGADGAADRISLEISGGTGGVTVTAAAAPAAGRSGDAAG